MRHAFRASTIAALLLPVLLTPPARAEEPARRDEILILGNPAGMQQSGTAANGVTRVEYSFNERGRGDHITATWKLDAAGIPLQYEGQGNDYWKAPLSRALRRRGRQGAAGRTASSTAPWHAPARFYLPANAPPEFMGVLARALLKAPRAPPAAAAGGRGAGSSACGPLDSSGAAPTLYRIAGHRVHAGAGVAGRAGRDRGRHRRLVLGAPAAQRPGCVRRLTGGAGACRPCLERRPCARARRTAATAR